MRKLRLLVAVFTFAMMTGCTDLGPTAPMECGEGECEGFLGSGD